MDAVHNAERLAELQALPLDRKIQISQARIIEWYQKHNGKVIVSFSGGKDSTVLLHLVRTLYPDVPAVFSNTGLEYPEIQRFVRSIPNVAIVTPKMRFDEVISTYGYPLIGKEVAEAIYYARRIHSQDVQVERENKGLRESIGGVSLPAPELAGGLALSRRAERRTDGPFCKADGEKQSSSGGLLGNRPKAQGRYGPVATADSGTSSDRNLGGAEQKPLDGRLSEPRNVEAMGPCGETTSRGKWHDYHRRSLNNDPDDPNDRECFFNRDPRSTDWHDWRRGCL